MDETPIKFSKAKDETGETGATLVTDAMIDIWDEFASDEDADYACVFAQPATQHNQRYSTKYKED